METKFTKGEWVVEDQKVVICNGSRVAIAYSGSNIPNLSNIEANARLIAQAPAMYEMLERDTKTLEDLIKTLPEYSNDWVFYKNELGIKMGLLAKCRGEIQ